MNSFITLKYLGLVEVNEQNKNIVLELIDIRKGSKDEQNNNR
mgnify:CR=1 FL=1